jgi:hypothetical protein
VSMMYIIRNKIKSYKVILPIWLIKIIFFFFD